MYKVTMDYESIIVMMVMKLDETQNTRVHTIKPVGYVLMNQCVTFVPCSHSI